MFAEAGEESSAVLVMKKTVLVASSKGGVGKTTLSTNLAAHFAVDGKRTVLVDADRQGSSRHWAQKRAHLDSAVLPIDGTHKNWDRELPKDAQAVVIDAAAGAHAASKRARRPKLSRGVAFAPFTTSARLLM